MPKIEERYHDDAERWRGFISQLNTLTFPYTCTPEFGALKCSVADQHAKYITWLEGEVLKIEIP